MTVSAPFGFAVAAFDNYFTGHLTDAIGPMQYELDMPQFYTDSAEYLVAAGTSQTIFMVPNNAAFPFFTGPYNGNSPSQTGILLLYQDGLTGKEAATIAVSSGLQ